MAKVYVSSTIVDLEPERQAVMDWLVTARHQPIHSYRPDSETVRESCLDDIDGCDLYVLLLGHRYGSQSQDDSPERLSITHLEFRRAGQSGIPRIALLRTSVPDINLSDLLDPERSALVRAFNAEVRLAVRPAEFNDAQGLIQALSTGVQEALARLSGDRGSAGPGEDTRVLRIVATLTEELDRKNRLLDERTAEIGNLRGRVTELEDQMRAAVVRTVSAAGTPNAGKAAIAAAKALDAGDTRPAEALLGKQERKEAARIGKPGADDARQRSEAAALAREQGALAIGHDVRAALTAYQRAGEYEPNDIWTNFFIGDLHTRLGDLSAAMLSLQRARAIVETLATKDPANPEWQRNISVSHNRIGDVLVAQGDAPGALGAYRKALAIVEALAASDPTIAEWQRDLSISHNRIGDMLHAQGDRESALGQYRQGLAIIHALTSRDPANTVWQRDLSVSHNKIGDVLIAHGDLPAASTAYHEGLALAEALTRRDPGNTEWQRDLSVSHNKLGDVLFGQGDFPAALTAYRKGLALAEALAGRDAANSQWQRDVAVCHNRIGGALAAEGDLRGALAAYQKAMTIVEALAARDPTNTLWQKDLAFSCGRLGSLGDGRTIAARREYLLRGRQILVKLREAGRLQPSEDWSGSFDQELALLPPESA